MPWFYLLSAGLLEVVWAFTMKRSAGFSLPVPTLITLGAMAASFTLLAAAMRSLPLSTAYPIWTGIGAIGAFLVGIIVLGEPLTTTRLLAAILILTGIILMKLA